MECDGYCITATIGIYEVPTGGAAAGAKLVLRSRCGNQWVRGNLSGHCVNPFVARSGLHKVHYPINLQVNPDRSAAMGWRKIPGAAIAAKGFFLVQGIAALRTGLAEVWELVFGQPGTDDD